VVSQGTGLRGAHALTHNHTFTHDDVDRDETCLRRPGELHPEFELPRLHLHQDREERWGEEVDRIPDENNQYHLSHTYHVCGDCLRQLYVSACIRTHSPPIELILVNL
jgi:hypothetical protein